MASDQVLSEFAHLQIPLEDVLEATDKFSDKNIIGKGGFGNVYKGQLKNSCGQSIKISARRLDRRYGQGQVEFWTEVSVLSSLKHKNIVSMIGFCNEQGEKIIIHHPYPKGSLYKHLSNGNLTCDQRLKICQGVADAVHYLHHIPGKSYHVIHRNINSFTILLDRNWLPKLSGFEFSIKHSNDRMNQVFISEPVGTKGYVDPETDKTGGVTYKSDIYSLGVVLFEIMCGRKAFNPDDHDNMFLVTLARSKFETKTLSELIHPNLQNQTLPMNSKAFQYLSQIAYYCTKEDRTRRDNAHQVRVSVSTVMKMQKGKKVTSVEDLFNRTDKVATKGATFKPNKVKKLEHLRISLEDIKLATNDFRKFPRFKSNESYVYYRGKLECFDREYVSGETVNNKDELPKRTYDVEIKHIKNTEYTFDTEIEILGSCKHRNIESLVGFCDEGPGMILVFEYLSKRSSLNFHLHRAEFTWEKRLKVCIDIAHGLDYLQNEMDTQNMVVHRDIASLNVKVVYGKWDAYIAEFQHAVFMPRNEALQLNDNRASTYYTDPEYAKTGKLKAESDIFSFGVVLFEILCGMSAHDIVSNEGRQEKRLEHVVGRWFKNGIIKNKVATSLQKESSENPFFLQNGLNKDSLDTFIAIAYQCLGEMQTQRPTIKVVIQELEKSLSFQRNHKTDTFRMSFEDIRLATRNFSDVIGVGGFGSVYIGELEQKHSYGHYAIVAKKLDTSHGQGHQQYYNELQILNKYRHENVIGLVGYSDETDEKLIVYERASKGSLDKYLNDAKLSWKKRLMICIDVASGIDFLHGGVGGQEVVIHRDIKTPNILLFDDWKAKLGDFGLSLISSIDKETEYTIDRACGTKGYVDPLYLKSGVLTIESDIYSFGVVLFEILCGRATYKIPNLLGFIRNKFEQGKQDEIVFKAIKEEILPKSLATFIDIVYKCLDDDRGKRPTSKQVLTQLNKALQIQVSRP